jgi:hypothetical protein
VVIVCGAAVPVMNGPVTRLTREQISAMEPNKPTPRKVYGTDASLPYQQQLDYVEKANSKLVTRLYSQIDSADMSELAELSQVLTRAQAIAMKGIGGTDQAQELTDEQLARAIKK